MTPTVFVDGQAGTTGLKILEYLEARADLSLLTIADAERKDRTVRARLINQADFVFLCLPDDAARESVALVDAANHRTRILDASTAHRTAAGWAYGVPELSSQHRSAVAGAARVAIPGCHASGFALAVYPLVAAGIVPRDYPITCQSLTGYSGGGKQMIQTWEDPGCVEQTRGARPYALSLWHKHLKEMEAVCQLTAPPVFQPVVFNYFNGMIVSIPLVKRLLHRPMGAQQVHAELAQRYADERFVDVMPYDAQPTIDGGYLDPTALNGTNRAQVFVFGDDERMAVCVRLDNLGKGASGAAIQCLNLMLGLDEGTGLR